MAHMSYPSKLAAALACAVFWLAAPTPAQAADDVTSPTAPGTPAFSDVTPFSVTLTWTHSTDDVGVTDYLVRRILLDGQSWNDSTTGDINTITIRDLTPNQTYSFTVLATDAAANTTASPTATVHTPPYLDGPMCSVTYTPLSSGGGSFYATVGMTNLSPGAWQEWTLGFTLTDNQRINPGWGFRQHGTRWTTSFVWLWSSGAGPLLPGNTRSVSFTGTYTGSDNPPPTDFTINDHPCHLVGQPVPPGQPQDLIVSDLTPGSISLRWSPAAPGTDPISRYEVLLNGYRYTCLGVNPLACAISGLTPATAYTIAVRAVDTTGRTGPATTITVRTPPSTPPSAPGNPAVSGVSTAGATLTWTASTPGTFPLTGYTVYRLDGTTETAVSVTPNAGSTTATLTGLTPNTPYSFRIRARDTAGVNSAPSATVAFTTKPDTGCDVAYSAKDWGTGFTATVKITNTGTAALTGWTLHFAFPAGQRLTHGWSAGGGPPAGAPPRPGGGAPPPPPPAGGGRGAPPPPP
ncbi:fibronectin type III domain-containing protein, partial [Catellatospora sp. NPDC049609]|uniref:fibronectin type III domain-containing protein n=1 Tax=Catellatospora sp. NPDC049609 TaxID=3155505 RepID=UPI003442B749